MHATGERLTQHHAGVTILGQLLEGCGAIFALLRYLANSNLVADYLNGFLTLHDAALISGNRILKYDNKIIIVLYLLGENTLDSTDILLVHLSVSDLLFHLTRLLWTTPKEQETRGESVEPMNRAKILQIELLGKYKDYSIVPVATTRMNLSIRNNILVRVNQRLLSVIFGLFSRYIKTRVKLISL